MAGEEKTDHLAYYSALPSGATSQADALLAEGVIVTTNALGELMVDLGEYGWFPRHLPSDVAAGIDESDSEG